jgi:hypothetical protein
MDWEKDQYQLYVFISPDAPSPLEGQIRSAADRELQDTNVKVDVVRLGQGTDHPAEKWLRQWGLAEFPCGVLISPDRQSLPLHRPEFGKPSEDSFAAVFRQVASSPVRERILQQAAEAFGVVLLVEGNEAAANARARQQVRLALEAIRQEMRFMPKTIQRPPVFLDLSRAKFAQERMLGWSLGLGTNQPVAPRAAVIYGKGRWLGPLMQGAEIAERNVTGILSFIGADCECGLDILWTRGTQLPVKWDTKLHALATRTLGFDPEDPLVKLEAGRILERWASLAGANEPGQAAGSAMTPGTKGGPAPRKPNPPARGPLAGTVPSPGMAEAPLCSLPAVVAVTLTFVALAAFLWAFRRRRIK